MLLAIIAGVATTAVLYQLDLAARAAQPGYGVSVAVEAQPPIPVRLPPGARDVPSGEAVYRRTCMGCHGAGAKGTDLAPGILVGINGYLRDDERLAGLIRAGRGGMPAFRASELSDRDLANLIAFLRSLPR